MALDSSLIFHDEMVAVGLFFFHFFFFIRASHKEAFGPGMGEEGARRVKSPSPEIWPGRGLQTTHLHLRRPSSNALAKTQTEYGSISTKTGPTSGLEYYVPIFDQPGFEIARSDFNFES